MKTINRIRFFATKSDRVRCYGVSRALTQRNDSFTADGPVEMPKDAEEEQRYRATLATCRVVNRLFELPGITHLRFRPYELNVTLSAVYDWSDVHDEIVAILKSEYFDGIDDVSVEERGKSEDE